MIGAVFFVFCVFIAVAFIIANLGNTVAVSLIFYNFSNVPVYVLVFCAFCLGFLVALLMCFFAGGHKKAKKTPKQPKVRKFFNFGKQKEQELPVTPDEVNI